MRDVAYLAIVAAEAVATLGALGQRALVAAGPAFFGTLLKKKRHRYPRMTEAAFYDRDKLWGKEIIVN